MGLLSRMNGVKANSGVWMEHTRLRKPTIRQTLHPGPIQMMPLATMNQHRPPEPHQPISESMQAVGVSRYRVVVEVTLHDRFEPFAGKRNRVVHAVAKLLLEFQQLGSHPLADCLTLYRKVPVLVLPADVRETQEIKRFRLAFPSSFPVLLGKSPELDPARLVWVKFQPELPQPFPKCLQETIRVGSMLKSEHIVVRIADDNHFPLRALLAPGIHPQVEHVMQINIRQQR